MDGWTQAQCPEVADVADPKTFWLTVTNIALGAFVVICFLVIAVGLLCEVLRRPRKRKSYRAELNHDMHEMFGFPHPQSHGWLHRRK